MAFCPSDLSANGAASSQPVGNAPGLETKTSQGLKARSITRADGSGLQPSSVSMDPAPWALPKAGMEWAFGPQKFS